MLSTYRHQIFSMKSGGKLVGDGLPKMLTGDVFYECVVEFTKWEQEQEKQKAERRVDAAGYKLEVNSRNSGQNWDHS